MTTEEILVKVNENQESDVTPYTIETIPQSLINFWKNYENIRSAI